MRHTMAPTGRHALIQKANAYTNHTQSQTTHDTPHMTRETTSINQSMITTVLVVPYQSLSVSVSQSLTDADTD